VVLPEIRVPHVDGLTVLRELRTMPDAPADRARRRPHRGRVRHVPAARRQGRVGRFDGRRRASGSSGSMPPDGGSFEPQASMLLTAGPHSGTTFDIAHPVRPGRGGSTCTPRPGQPEPANGGVRMCLPLQDGSEQVGVVARRVCVSPAEENTFGGHHVEMTASHSPPLAVDDRGNALISFVLAAEDTPPRDAPLPLALVALWQGNRRPDGVRPVPAGLGTARRANRPW
jgi:hypothetical protein